VKGGKSWYGSLFRLGTKGTVHDCGLIECVKLCDVEPMAHLLTLTRPALLSPGTTTVTGAS